MRREGGSFIRGYRADERGRATAIIALAVLALIGASTLATDIGLL
jgi:hypothetical protein